MKARLALAIAALALLAGPAAADRYWVATLPNFSDIQDSIVLLNVHRYDIEAKVQSGGSTTTVVVPGGGFAIHNLSSPQGTVRTAFIDTPGGVVVYHHSPLLDIFTNDATHVLEERDLGKRHMAHTLGPGSPYLLVVGTQPDTGITLRLASAATVAGSTLAAGTHTMPLQPGKAILAVGSGDLTGSLVEATKPVAFYSGNTCTWLGYSACDAVSEMDAPLERAGTTTVVCSTLPERRLTPTPAGQAAAQLAGGDGYDRIQVAATAPTTVAVQPQPLELLAPSFTLPAANSWRPLNVTQDTVLVATQPVQVARFLGKGVPSQQWDGGTVTGAGAILFTTVDPLGDPHKVVVLPTTQWRPTARAYVAPGWLSYAIVAAPATAEAWVDGSPVTWRPIPGTGFKCGYAPLAAGLHGFVASEPALFEVAGWSSFSSYSFLAAPPTPTYPPTLAIASFQTPATCIQAARVTLNAFVADPDGSTVEVIWSLAQGDLSGLSVQTILGPGTHDVTAVATDRDGDTAVATMTVTVPPPPTCCPEAAGIGPFVVRPGALITFQATATDLDGPPATFVARLAPQGSTFWAANASFRWRTTAEDLGLHTMWVTASDGQCQDEVRVLFLVLPPGVAAPPMTDIDQDGVADWGDNCPHVPNHDGADDQRDSDHDGAGDACDPVAPRRGENGATAAFNVRDRDGDGVTDGLDRCPARWDPTQRDLDGDGMGDACDADLDGDGVPESPATGFPDNCPAVPNQMQEDADLDGTGDACDAAAPAATPCDCPPAGAVAAAARASPLPGLVPGLAALGAAVLVRRR